MAKKKTTKDAGPAGELERAFDLLERGKLEQALERADAAIAGGVSGDDLCYAHFLRGACFADGGEPRKAREAFEIGLTCFPDDPVLVAAHGEALFNLWEFEKAEAGLARAVQLFGADLPERDPYAAAAHRHLALCLDRRGDHAKAARHFERAHALDPDSWPRPVRLARPEFDRLARAAVDSLPPFVKEKLGEIGFLVEDYPRLAQLADRADDADPQTLGLFFGTDVAERYAERPPSFVPNQVVLFQRNLEQFASDRAALEEEIRTTVYHEVGHYLGYDEEGLEKIGLA